MRTRKFGFTLIELLVVIAIIALLMAILLPTLGRVRRQARTVACQSNLRQWSTVFYMYIEDNDGQFPRHQSFHLQADRAWPYTLREHYSDNDDLLLCPAALKHRVRPDNPWPVPSPIGMEELGDTFTAWKIGTIHPDLVFTGSYGLNENVDHKIFIISPRRPDPNVPPPLAPKASVPVLLDCVYVNGHPLFWDEPPAYEDAIGGRPGDMTYFCINRHVGGVNGLFMDWSARKVGLKELWTLAWGPISRMDGPWTKAGGVQPEAWPVWMRRFKDY